MRILLAEDERDLNRIIAKKLTADGYSVDCCFDGAEALDYAASADYDVMVLDIMMPKLDGLAVLRTLRQRGDATPVLLLTARDAVADRVKGLDSGANDYLVKPFSNTELILRVKSLLRRAGQYARQYTGSGEKGGAEEGHRIAYRDLVLDLDSQSVEKEGKTIALTYTEFQILLLFLRNRKRIFSPENLYQSVWKEEAVGDGAIMVHIKNLRKKLGDDSRNSRYIKTAWGKGYYAD